MHITFYGAVGGVTGSKHLITIGDKNILLECGMHQGHWKEAYEKNKALPFDARTIDAVVLSHAHIDHSGLLPVLVKNGFTGPIYTRHATAKLLAPLWYDAASIQKEDYEHYSALAQTDPTIDVATPLFDEDDVRATLRLLVPQHRETPFRVAGVADVTFYNAGHILGSAQVHLKANDREIAFTGDLGSRHRKILNDPQHIPHADIFITEATYGGRLHKRQAQTRDDLATIITDTYSRKGRVIIPSFALERTQELLYDLHKLYNEKKVPRLPVFVDSPLATDFTKIFTQHLDDFDEETHDFFIAKGQNPFSFKRLIHTTSTRESKKLNHYSKPCIVIAGSGMCEAGRIKHHLRHGLDNPRNTVLFVGYQARHTLGRKISERQSPVRIFGHMVDVKAHIETISGYSAHGDQKELIANITATNGIKKLIIVHADPEQATALAQKLRETFAPYTITIPTPKQRIDL